MRLPRKRQMSTISQRMMVRMVNEFINPGLPKLLCVHTVPLDIEHFRLSSWGLQDKRLEKGLDEQPAYQHTGGTRCVHLSRLSPILLLSACKQVHINLRIVFWWWGWWWVGGCVCGRGRGHAFYSLSLPGHTQGHPPKNLLIMTG